MKRIYACFAIVAALLATAFYSSFQVQRFADDISTDLDCAIEAIRTSDLPTARQALARGADRCDRMREKMNHLLRTEDFTELEAALRTAYFTLKGENPPADAFKAVRSGGFQENSGVQEAEFAIGDIRLRIAAVSGLGNTRRLLQQIERGEVHYDFVEVMACPGGCVGGGGQPIHDGEELAFARGRKLYALDAKAKLRYSHENPDIKEIYSDFFGKPMSHKAHMLLHTEHWKNK